MRGLTLFIKQVNVANLKIYILGCIGASISNIIPKEVGATHYIIEQIRVSFLGVLSGMLLAYNYLSQNSNVQKSGTYRVFHIICKLLKKVRFIFLGAAFKNTDQ